MENKYYIPEIEEFHVGFEYETKNYSGIWIKNICETSYSDQHYVCIPIPEYDYNYDNENTRVKYLDREDIEELGWKLDSTVEKEAFYIHNSNSFDSKDEWLLVFREKENSIEIYSGKKDSLAFSFYGVVKNKSELKRLHVQLNILEKS